MTLYRILFKPKHLKLLVEQFTDDMQSINPNVREYAVNIDDHHILIWSLGQTSSSRRVINDDLVEEFIMLIKLRNKDALWALLNSEENIETSNTRGGSNTLLF